MRLLLAAAAALLLAATGLLVPRETSGRGAAPDAARVDSRLEAGQPLPAPPTGAVAGEGEAGSTRPSGWGLLPPRVERDSQVSAALDSTQKQLAKLAKKLAAKQAQIVAKQLKVTTYQDKLAAAQLQLLAAYAMPEGTEAEIKARNKAINLALKMIAKWQKKIDAALAKLDKYATTAAALTEEINAIDPDYLDGGGDGGDQGAQGDVSVPVLIQAALPPGAPSFARTGAVATFGIPFAESDEVTEIEGRPALGFNGADMYQFRTLRTWPDGFVKWALVDVAADVPAGGSNAGLEIVAGSGASAQAPIASQLGSLIRLDTGPMVADIVTTGFNLFDRVRVGGLDVVAPHESPGIVAAGSSGETLIVSPDTTVVIEENGPARAVVRADGTLRTLAGTDVIDFTCRITARAGSPDAEVTFTVRNASIARPAHVVLEGIELVVRALPGADAVARIARHDGEENTAMPPGSSAYLYEAYTSAPTSDVLGTGSGYKPHIPKLTSSTLAEEGYSLVKDGVVLHALGDRDEYPAYGYADLTGSAGGITVAAREMPYWWPAGLGVAGNGDVTAGIFTAANAARYTFCWRQHESRTVVFSFHAGAMANPSLVAKALDAPVAGRALDYDQYDHSGAFPYRLLTIAEENEAYAAMGVDHVVTIGNDKIGVTRYLAAHNTGGPNNHDAIEKQLCGEWLRHGHGGQYQNALDLALYKSEWQILRSDDFDSKDDPGASNDGAPHSINYPGDLEHRYRDGMIDAYFLTGDERFHDALLDEAENLRLLTLNQQERSMYQSLRAMALVGEFAGDDVLKTKLKQRLQYFDTPLLDVTTGANGFGWQAPPGLGDRRYYVASSQNTDEKVPGENYVTRGFITGSLGPIGLYHAVRWLGTDDVDGDIAQQRLVDLAFYTRNELFPYFPDPVDRHLVYSWGVATQQVIGWEAVDYHPILLGMAEAFLQTGDVTYLQKGIEQIEAFHAHDSGPYADNLYLMDSRLDVQHFLSVYLDVVHASQP